MRQTHPVVILAGTWVGLLLALGDGPPESAESALTMVLAALAASPLFVAAIAMCEEPGASQFASSDVVRALLLGMVSAGVVPGWLAMARVLERKPTVAVGPDLCLGALLTLDLG